MKEWLEQISLIGLLVRASIHLETNFYSLPSDTEAGSTLLRALGP